MLVRVNPEVQKALDENRPVVALESTIISHGMPYPQNVETALKVEEIIRSEGAMPATIGIINGEVEGNISNIIHHINLEYFRRKETYKKTRSTV